MPANSTLTTAAPTRPGNARSVASHSAAPPVDASALAASPGVRPLSLRRNFAWTFASNVIYASCQWGMLVALAKLTTQEMLGRFALGLAVAAPVILFLELQLRVVQATDARRQYAFGDYLAVRLLTVGMGLVVITVIVLESGYGASTSAVILIVGIIKSFESVSDIAFGAMQQRERMDRISHSLIARGLVSVLAMTLVLYLTRSVLWGVVVVAGLRAVQLVAYDLPAVRWVARGDANILRPHWRVTTLAKLAWLSLPLGIAGGLISLRANIPRYLIEHHLGMRELGVFAAVAYTTMIGATLSTAIAQPAIPRLAHLHADGEHSKFLRLVLKIVLVCVLIGVAGVLLAALAGRFILTVLYSAEYAEHSDIFVWLMATFGLQLLGGFFRSAVRAMRRFRTQLAVSLLSISILVACGICWIPEHRLLGATWAIGVGVLTEVAAYTAILALYLRKPRDATYGAIAFVGNEVA